MNVVRGGSTRTQPAPSFYSPYHQSLDLLVAPDAIPGLTVPGGAMPQMDQMSP